MRYDYIGVGLAILAIGITVVLAVPPPWWPKMPGPLVQLAVGIGLMFAAVGLGITGLGTWPGLPNPRGPLALILIGCSLVLLGSIWWRFDPSFGARTLNTVNSANFEPKSRYACAPPPKQDTVKAPPLQIDLVIDLVDTSASSMHLNVHNISGDNISIHRVRSEMNASAALEFRSPGPRLIAPNATIEVGLLHLSSIAASKVIRLAMDYTLIGDNVPETERTISVKFIAPANVSSGSIIRPSEAIDNLSTWNKESAEKGLLPRLNEVRGGCSFVFDTVKADGSWNKVSFNTPRREFYFDPPKGIVRFVTVNGTNNSERKLESHFEPGTSTRYAVLLSWNENTVDSFIEIKEITTSTSLLEPSPVAPAPPAQPEKK